MAAYGKRHEINVNCKKNDSQSAKVTTIRYEVIEWLHFYLCPFHFGSLIRFHLIEFNMKLIQLEIDHDASEQIFFDYKMKDKTTSIYTHTDQPNQIVCIERISREKDRKYKRKMK